MPAFSRFVLGIDLGTTQCKVSLINSVGDVLRSEAAAYPTLSPKPLWSEQDPGQWLVAIILATHRVIGATGIDKANISGICLSSAAHIGVLLGQDGRPLRPAILWNDQRSYAEVEQLEQHHGQEILSITMQRLTTTWTLPHLLWIKQHEPEIWAKKARVMLSKDYIVQWLTGKAVTDPATALSSQLFDPKTGFWSAELCALIELDSDELPEVAPATSVAGGLTSQSAGILGLAAGTPVIIGTLDSISETFAAGTIQPGQGVIRLATAGGVNLILENPQPSRVLISYPYILNPLWMCQAGTNSCTSAISWAIQTLSREEKISYAKWDDMVEKVPAGSEGLFFHPYLIGERFPYWDPKLRASFVGATIRHTTNHFARAVYEGTAYSIRDAVIGLEKLGFIANQLTVVGGGTASATWVKILAEVLGRTLQVAKKVDSSYGAGLIGLSGLGLRDLGSGTGFQSHKMSDTVEPGMENAQVYADMHQIYTQVGLCLQPLYHLLS